MTLAELTRKYVPYVSSLTEMGRRDTITLTCRDSTIDISLDKENLTEEMRDLIEASSDQSFLFKLQLWTQTQVYGKGPKVFRPTAYQLFMLERMQLNLTAKDFAMPFETIVIELPEDYIKARTVEGLRPELVVFHYKEIMLHTVWFGKVCLTSWWRTDTEAEIETWFRGGFHEYRDPRDLPSSEQEGQLEKQIRRAIINYCLLLDEVGIKKRGPAIPNEYAKLVKWCQKDNKHTPKNKLELLRSPIIYEMSRETELVRVVDESGKLPGEPTGRQVSPHSRRGYYRRQRHGPGNTLEKRVRIPPTIVNKHLLTGDMWQEKIYKT